MLVIATILVSNNTRQTREKRKVRVRPVRKTVHAPPVPAPSGAAWNCWPKLDDVDALIALDALQKRFAGMLPEGQTEAPVIPNSPVKDF